VSLGEPYIYFGCGYAIPFPYSSAYDKQMPPPPNSAHVEVCIGPYPVQRLEYTRHTFQIAGTAQFSSADKIYTELFTF